VHYGDFLRSPERIRHAATSPTDYRRVVLQQKWNGEEPSRSRHTPILPFAAFTSSSKVKRIFAAAAAGAVVPGAGEVLQSRSCVLISSEAVARLLCRCMSSLSRFTCTFASEPNRAVADLLSSIPDSHDPRRQEISTSFFLVIRLVVREEISQQGELRKARPPFQVLLSVR